MIREQLRKNRLILCICIISFILGTPLGYLSYESLEEQMMPVLKQLVSEISEESQLQMSANIFFNNYKVAVMLTLLGTLILPPIFILFVNGFVMGFVLKLLEEKNLGIILFIQGVTLHGLFELPALFLSAATGIRVGLSFLTLDNKKRTKQASENIKEAIRIHFLLVLPMLILAALIEVFISAALITQ